jgi:predicted MFS family arabinose efflux permease
MKNRDNLEFSSTKTKRYATAKVVALTTLVQALATLCTLVPATIAPELASAFGLPASMIGYQVSLIYFGAIITSLAGGILIRRFGALRTSQIALIFSGSGLVLSAAPSIFTYATGSILIGFGYGLTNPAASHLLMQISRPENRNFIFSLKQTGVPLGAVCAGLSAPTLAILCGWQWTFLILGAITLGFVILIQPFQPKLDWDRDKTASMKYNLNDDLGMVWNNPTLRMLSLAAFCFSAVQISLSAFAVIMLVEDLSFGLVQAGIVLSVLQVAGMIGRVLWGGIADWLEDANRVLLVVALIAALAGILTMSLSPNTSIFVVYLVLCLFGVSAIGWNGVFLAEIARLAPEGRVSNATVGAMVPTYTGVVVGPATFAALHGLSGMHTATFGVFSFVSLIGFSLVFSARRRIIKTITNS